jgi:hypothetical protein
MGSPIHHGAFSVPLTRTGQETSLAGRFQGTIERVFTILGDLEPNHLEELNTYSERLTRRKATFCEEHSPVVLNAWAAIAVAFGRPRKRAEKYVQTSR